MRRASPHVRRHLRVGRLDLDLRGIAPETAEAAARALGPALARALQVRSASRLGESGPGIRDSRFRPADRIDAVCERLLGAGLRRQPAFGASRDPAHHERVFFHGRILVEVHQSFIQRARHRVDYEGVWQRSVPLEIDGRRVRRLDDVDALVYHTLSMAIDQFNARLVRYVDLWLLLGRAPGIALAP